MAFWQFELNLCLRYPQNEYLYIDVCLFSWSSLLLQGADFDISVSVHVWYCWWFCVCITELLNSWSYSLYFFCGEIHRYLLMTDFYFTWSSAKNRFSVIDLSIQHKISQLLLFTVFTHWSPLWLAFLWEIDNHSIS